MVNPDNSALKGVNGKQKRTATILRLPPDANVTTRLKTTRANRLRLFMFQHPPKVRHSQRVTNRAKTGDLSGAYGHDDRVYAKRFAGVDVRQVYLDCVYSYRCDGIAKSDAIMCERPGV